MGRPNEQPKLHKITVRIDEKSKETLDRYCEQKSVNQAEAVRQGIIKLDSDLKK